MKLVHIEWTDAHHIGPGTWIEPVDIVPGVKVITVGFLLSSKRKHYTVATTIDEAGNATGVFAIPQACVRRFAVITP